MRVTPIDSEKKKKRFEMKTALIILPLIIILFILLITDLLLIRSRRKIVNEQIRIYANYQIADQLNKHLFFGTIWGTIIDQDGGEVKHFSKTTEHLLKNYDIKGIESISLAQANHVVYTHSLNSAYPVKRDIFTDADLQGYVIRSKFTGLQSVSHMSRIEGTDQYHMYVLTPVYVNGDFGKREFWGVTLIAMRIPEILEGIALDKMSTDIDFKLSGAVEGSEEHQAFIETKQEEFRSPEVYYFQVPNGTWKLEGEWKGGWITRTEMIQQALAFLFVGAGVVILLSINSRRAMLAKISMQDELTGINNRYSLRIHFPEYVGTKKDIFVLFVDVDRFKEVNDTFGHEAGDQALQAVAEKLSEFFGAKNCYRYGGDEFLVVQKSDNGEKLKEKLASFRTELDLTDRNGRGIHITLSAGCCVGKAENGDALRRLMKEADEKLYEAKHNGKNQIDM